MLVSIIVRTYSGREPLLLRALNSLAAQDTANKYEAIVVVDGVQPLDPGKFDIGQFAFARAYHPAAQMGRSEAANLGLEKSQGDALNFLDDDDWLLPNHVELLANTLKANPDAAAAYAAAWELHATTDISNPELGIYGNRRKFFYPEASSIDLIDRNLFPIQAVMFRREVVDRGVRMARELDALEDWLFWQQALIGKRLAPVNAITSTHLVPLRPASIRQRLIKHEEAMPTLVELQASLMVPFGSLIEASARRSTPQKTQVTAFGTSGHHWLATLALRRRTLASSRHRTIVQALELQALTLGRDLMLGPVRRSAPVLRNGIRSLRNVVGSRQGAKARALATILDPALFYRPETPPTKETVAGRDVIFTACNWRYVDKALALASSCRRHMPDHDFHILLADGAQIPEGLDTKLLDGITIVPISHLPIMSQAWCFAHSVVELSTAVKPAYALRLMDAGAKSLMYLDPDTLLLAPLDSVLEALCSSDVVLTPHLHRPAKTRETIEAFEISAMAHGIYNLGFFACGNTKAARDVVAYWYDRCEQYCFSDVPRGLFTDQKWFDHVPVFFTGIKVLECPTVNAAVWNMEGRVLSRVEGRYLVDGARLEMFHFSGWDKGVPSHFASTTLEGSAGKRLIAEYTSLLETYVVDGDSTLWRYGYYADGSPITQAQRTCYRRNPDLQEAFKEPFAVGERTFRDWILSEGLGAIEDRYDESTWVRRYY